MINKPATVLHFLGRAEAFHRAANDLAALNAEGHAAAIGLLCVHAAISLADAALVALGAERSRGQDHRDTVKALRKWCAAKQVDGPGPDHLSWLVGKKNHFSYDENTVQPQDFQHALVKKDQFFKWVFRAFPGVAQLSGERDDE
jgi:hypothetical protein